MQSFPYRFGKTSTRARQWALEDVALPVHDLPARSSLTETILFFLVVFGFRIALGQADVTYTSFSFNNRIESAISNQYNGLTQSFWDIAPGVDMRITTSMYGAVTYNYTRSASTGDLTAFYTSTKGWNAVDNPVAGSNPLGLNYTLSFFEADSGHSFSTPKVLSNFRFLFYDVDGSSSGGGTNTVVSTTNGVTTTNTIVTPPQIVQSEAVRVLAGSGFVSYQLTPDTTLTAIEADGAWQFNGNNVNVANTLPSMVIMNFADSSEVRFQFEAPYSRDANDPVATFLDGDVTFINSTQLASFSTPTGVPEPSVGSLLVAGAALALRRKRKLKGEK
jgi:hypothetical protein